MKSTESMRTGFWNRSHHLDRMTLRELVVAYFQYPAIMAYLAVAALAIGAWAWRPASLVETLASIFIASMIYPLVWYCLHRWVLHSKWMWKSKLLAPTWKRIHYDHHQDPNHLEVLFGGLHTTLPTIVLATVPVGYAIGEFGGAAAALATGLITTCVYEFFHCIQHLAYKPKNKWVASIKQRHMQHHFHNENGNYGITNYFWDRLFGTFYEKAGERPKSPTVFNLGYTQEVAEDYPHVSRLSGGVATGHPRQRQRN
ncbi:hypothetical protein ACFB49_47750 [Sphingomonas sp. DBB INV C78]